MNEVPPLTENQPPLPVDPEFKDRRTGLIIFGVLEIILGAILVLVTVLMAALPLIIPQNAAMPTDMRMMIPAIAMYGFLAGMFVWLGIGSIRCRRWARALLLILGWAWLCVGIITVLMMAIILPRALSTALPPGQTIPPGMLKMILIIQLAFMTVIFVALPAALVLFYSTRHVKATCNARDPVPRWTDACPLPVLGVACALWLGALFMVGFPWAYHGVMPMFGTILSRVPGILVALAMAGLWWWLGWKWYRRQIVGWWVLMATLLVLAISGAITFSRIDLMELYEKMGYQQAQIDLIRRQGIISNRLFLWGPVVWIPFLGYLIWVKRFFQPKSSPD